MSSVKLARLSPQGKLIAAAVPSPVPVARTIVFGHSGAAGAGVATPATNRATARLAGLLGGTETNLASSDSVLVYDGFQDPRAPVTSGTTGWPTVYPASTGTRALPVAPSDRGLAIMWWGMYDALVSSTTPGFKQALRAAVSRWRLHQLFPHTTPYRVAQTGWNAARTTAAGTGADGDAYVAAAVVGATFQLVIPADVAVAYPDRVVALGFVMTGGEATVSVRVNGADTRSYTFITTLGNMSPGVVRRTVPSGAVTIDVEVLAIDSGAEIGFDWVGIEAEVPSPVGIPEVHHTLPSSAISTLTAAGWPNASAFVGGGLQIAAAFNTAIDDVCSEFGSRVCRLPVQGVVPQQSSSRFFASGDVLFNEYAHALLAGAWARTLLAGPLDAGHDLACEIA